jgi:AraC-like DNA-binding protein
MALAHGQLSVREYGTGHASHSHDHFQVLVGLEGALELEVEGRGRRIAAGDGAVVAPSERHDFESAAGSRCLVLDSRDELWARCAIAPAHPAQARSLAAFLAQALLNPRSLAATHGPALLLESWLPATAGQQRPRRAIDWQALGDWVQPRLGEPLAVADLAARTFLSPSQFALRCREANGVSAMQWLRLQRLARARQLREAGWPVAQVARQTGYRSPSALTAALRRSDR